MELKEKYIIISNEFDDSIFVWLRICHCNRACALLWNNGKYVSVSSDRITHSIAVHEL